jgi:hypothetical protein
MDFAPQDFINVVSSYLTWPDRRIICNNCDIFSRVHSDKLLITDIVKWSSSSQLIKMEELISNLFSSYVLIEHTSDLDGFDNNVISGPTVEGIIRIIESHMEMFRNKEMQITTDLTEKIDKVIIQMYINGNFETCQTHISIVSNEEDLIKIGSYLCNLKRRDVEIDTELVKYRLEHYGNK